MQDGKLLVPSKEVLGILIAVCSIAFYIYRLGLVSSETKFLGTRMIR